MNFQWKHWLKMPEKFQVCFCMRTICAAKAQKETHGLFLKPPTHSTKELKRDTVSRLWFCPYGQKFACPRAVHLDNDLLQELWKKSWGPRNYCRKWLLWRTKHQVKCRSRLPHVGVMKFAFYIIDMVEREFVNFTMEIAMNWFRSRSAKPNSNV